jgi:hypothetical protein
MIEIKIDFKNVLKKLAKVNKKELTKLISKALSKVALEIRKNSIPLTPRGTGDLVNSWKVVKKDELTLEIGYDIIYAMYQHQGMREDGTYIIRNRPAGGQSFFLKDPIDQNLKKHFDIYDNTIMEGLNKLWR